MYIIQYAIPFYMQYLAHWPEYFQVAESPTGEIMGYSKFTQSNKHYHHYNIIKYTNTKKKAQTPGSSSYGLANIYYFILVNDTMCMCVYYIIKYKIILF